MTNPERGRRYNLTQARNDALVHMLYHGFSPTDSCGPTVPLLRTTEQKHSFERNLRRFFDRNGQWTEYSRAAAITTSTESGADRHFDVIISMSALRDFLNEQGITKSLTEGF